MINFLNHLIKTYFQFINKYKILFYGISLNVFSSLPKDLKKNPLKTIRPAKAVDATTLSGGRLSKKVTTNEIPAAIVARGNQRFIASSFLCIIVV